LNSHRGVGPEGSVRGKTARGMVHLSRCHYGASALTRLISVVLHREAEFRWGDREQYLGVLVDR